MTDSRRSAIFTVVLAAMSAAIRLEMFCLESPDLG